MEMLVRMADGIMQAYLSQWVARSKSQTLTSGLFPFYATLRNRGYEMTRGTYIGEEAMYKFMPEEVPNPLGWGAYKSRPDRHF